MRDVAEKMQKRGKSLATTFADPDDARRWIAEGYRMMNVGTVLQLGTDRTKEIFSDFIPQLPYRTRGFYFVPLKTSYSKIK